MAQTKKKRSRKHRGTQGGSIDRRGRTGRPRNRAEARAQARQRTTNRGGLAPPTWRSATIRGLIAAGAFYAILSLGFGRSTGQALGLATFMLAFYIPLGYYTDNFFYKRRARRAREEAQRRKAERKGKG